MKRKHTDKSPLYNPARRQTFPLELSGLLLPLVWSNNKKMTCYNNFKLIKVWKMLTKTCKFNISPLIKSKSKTSDLSGNYSENVNNNLVKRHFTNFSMGHKFPKSYIIISYQFTLIKISTKCHCIGWQSKHTIKIILLKIIIIIKDF